MLIKAFQTRKCDETAKQVDSSVPQDERNHAEEEKIVEKYLPRLMLVKYTPAAGMVMLE